MLRIENEPIKIHSINLVFRVIKRVQQFLCDIDPCHSKEEPLIFNLTSFVHLKGFRGIFAIRNKIRELLQAKQTRSSEVCRGVCALEANVYPFLGNSLSELLIRFQCAPKFHQHLLMLRIFLRIRLNFGPRSLHLVIETNSVE